MAHSFGFCRASVSQGASQRPRLGELYSTTITPNIFGPLLLLRAGKPDVIQPSNRSPAWILLSPFHSWENQASKRWSNWTKFMQQEMAKAGLTLGSVWSGHLPSEHVTSLILAGEDHSGSRRVAGSYIGGGALQIQCIFSI